MKFLAILLSFILISGSAFADFPSDQIKKAAMDSFKQQIANPKSYVGFNHSKLLRQGYNIDENGLQVIILTQMVSRTDVTAHVKVIQPYRQSTAGGNMTATIVSKPWGVYISTDANTGDVKSTKVSVNNTFDVYAP